MNEDVHREIEQFLYREARLLDERRFDDWLALLSDDVRYWMAGRSNRYPRHSKAIAILDAARYVEDDMARDDELAILDEDKQSLTGRVRRLDTGMAWAEDPPSRTRHLITNIELAPGAMASETWSIQISSPIAAAAKLSRIFMSAPAATGCGASTASGKLPSAR